MFAKVFNQIFDSSIAENWQVRHVFTDLLTLADLDGVVDMTAEAIARRTNTPLKVVSTSIKALEEPDPKSRSTDQQGRRIMRLDGHRDWGWQIVNYKHYRNLASEEQRRAKTAERTRRWRDKTDCDAPVTQGDACDAMQRQRQRQIEEEPPKPPQGGFAPSVVASESETKALAKAQRLGKARPALHYLNEKSGRRYSESESNLTLIAARMEEVEWDFVGVKQMVDRQVEKWRGTSMEDYLRPTTLFNKTKFDGYWAARCEPILNGDKPNRPDRGDRILAQLNKMKV